MPKFRYTLPAETSQNIGRRIALLRNEKGLTQQQLADKLKVSRSMIASIESGERLPDVKLWVSISLFFKVSTDYIAGTGTNRTYKTFSGCEKMDLDKLSPRDRDLLYNFYLTLLEHSENDY